MGLLDSVNNTVGGGISSVKDGVASILSPLTGKSDKPYNYGDSDYDSLSIEELEGPKKKVYLAGNQLPKEFLPFGGKQRINKDYYSGYSEPVIQVLGPEETDTIIKGVLKDKRLPKNYKGASMELQQLIDSIRIRGNICKIDLIPNRDGIDPWTRYGMIEQCDFKIKSGSEVEYEIKLMIVGFSLPQNAKFLNDSKEVPFKINEELIAKASIIDNKKLPNGIPFNIANELNKLVGEISKALAVLTGFVDSIIKTIDDIVKSVNRALGLIAFLKNKIRSYVNYVKGWDYNKLSTLSLTSKYSHGKYASKEISFYTSMLALLNAFQQKFRQLILQVPRSRHLVSAGETLQNISMKYFKDASYWNKIYTYNNLTSTELISGQFLDIPRVTK